MATGRMCASYWWVAKIEGLGGWEVFFVLKSSDGFVDGRSQLGAENYTDGSAAGGTFWASLEDPRARRGGPSPGGSWGSSGLRNYR